MSKKKASLNCENIDEDELPVVVDALIDKKTLIPHQIENFNNFIEQGLPQIVCDLFKIELSVQNNRETTPEDRRITSYSVSGTFTSPKLLKPTTLVQETGRMDRIMPQEARENKKNYSGPLYIGIELEITAFMNNNEPPEKRSVSIKDFHIANIPIMVGSTLCHTANMPKAVKAKIGEDPNDPGGHFIINGQEWILDSQESRIFNSPHIFRNVGHEKEITRLEFISKPGDGYENSSEHIIRYVTDGNIYITLTSIDYFKLDVPFYIIFRLMGMISDQEIFDNIIYRSGNTMGNDVIADHMFEILETAMTAHDRIFAKASKIVDQARLIEEYVEATAVFHKTYSGEPIVLDAKTKAYMCNQITTILDKWMLPHIGVDADSRHKKLRYLGHMIHKMLLVEMQVDNSTDRDNIKNRRVNGAGRSFARAFKRDFNMSIVMLIKKRLQQDLKHVSFSNINLEQVIKNSVDAPALEKALIQTIVTGDKEITVRGKAVPNRVSSEMLHRKNQLNVISGMRTVRSANSSSSKQDQRADEMRRAHSSFTGYFCPLQSADTGSQVGMIRSFSLDSYLSEPSSSELLKKKLLTDEQIIPLEKILPTRIYELNLTKILVNGDWIGCTTEVEIIYYRYREYRRCVKFIDFETIPEVTKEPIIDANVTIQWDTNSNELSFWVDAGRMMRPLLIVRNNGELDPYGRKYFGTAHDPYKIPNESGFIQDVMITREMVDGLMSKTVTIDQLYKAGMIDYISSDESEGLLIAPGLKALRDAKNDPYRPYTHCEIPACIMGLAVLTSPFAHNNQPPRLTFQTNQTKQTCGWFSLAWPYRMDKHSFLQYYAEMPLIKTIANKYLYPNGVNSLSAIASYGGYNQEDSLFYNQFASDRGFVKGIAYGFVQAELEKNEHFGNPDLVQTIDIKSHANYNKIVKGVPARGTRITNRDVIIGRYIDNSKPTSRHLYKDTSVIYPHTEPARVERVISSRDQERTHFIKVKYSSVRALNVGSKFSSRAGQKGVTGAGMNQADILFSSSGISPDLTMNPHAIPSRMTVGHIIEGVASKASLIKGVIGDGTIFRTTDPEEICDVLEEAGIDRYCNKRMFDGRSGEWIDVPINTSMVYYQRLQKFGDEEVYSISTGPTCILTRQPLEGKSKKGGLRIGEMEKDVIISHGAGHFLMEKFRDDSDGFDIYVCRTCKTMPVVNETIGLVICKTCREAHTTPQVHKVRSTWASKLFLQELESMGVGVLLDIEPYAYEKF